MSQPMATVLDGVRLRGQLEKLATAAGIPQWDLGASCSTDTSVQVDQIGRAHV